MSKILPPQELDPRTDQSVASRYTGLENFNTLILSNVTSTDIHNRQAVNPLNKKRYLSGLKIQSVPRSKQSASVLKIGKLMQYREIIAVCSQIHTKHINTLCGQNAELYIKIKSVPRSKHTPSRLYNPVS